MSHTNGWIGVDLDGTLAEYNGWQGPTHIGPPVPLMVMRIKGWLAEGRTVKIFTARVSHDGSAPRIREAVEALQAIQLWCVEHLGHRLEVTNHKDYDMIELYDDRCVQVEFNTGKLVGKSTRNSA